MRRLGVSGGGNQVRIVALLGACAIDRVVASQTERMPDRDLDRLIAEIADAENRS